MYKNPEELLVEIQRRAFRFFIEKSSPLTGLIVDRAGNFGDDNYTAASIASTGYALAALPVGAHNCWIMSGEAAHRAERILKFLLKMDHKNGWFPHFVHKADGTRMWNSEFSTIDTALLVAGAIACGQYFGGESTRMADELYQRLDWQWVLTNGGTQPNKITLSHGWTPERGFIPYEYYHYSEAILLYLLGLGPKNNPLPPEAWDKLERPVQEQNGLTALAGGPIFIHQMPMGFINLKGLKDRLGIDYWASSTNAMRIHKKFCASRAAQSLTYSRGLWGLNASDGPDGYAAYGTSKDNPEDGTVSPTGAIASITFTPELAREAAQRFYNLSRGNEKHGLWGRYGFSNAVNLDRDWHSPDVIGIDLGMVLLAIENHRNGFIWKLTQRYQPVQKGLEVAGLEQPPS